MSSAWCCDEIYRPPPPQYQVILKLSDPKKNPNILHEVSVN